MAHERMLEWVINIDGVDYQMLLSDESVNWTPHNQLYTTEDLQEIKKRDEHMECTITIVLVGITSWRVMRRQ